MTPFDAEPLSEWMTVADAAAWLGISRQSVHAWMERDEFKTITYITTGPSGKPLYLLSKAEVHQKML